MTGKELSHIRMAFGFSQDEFAKALGLSRGYISRIEAAKDEEIPHQLEFKSKKLALEMQILKSSEDIKTVLEEKGKRLSHYAAVDKIQTKPIPYFDVDVMMTPIEVFNDQTTTPAYKIDMPGFADCDFAINVFGHSMYPTIESGMIVLCKKLNDKTLIVPGEIYFIVTADYRMVKRLKKSDKKGFVIAASDNHNGHGSADGHTYGSVELPVDKILHLYLVKGSFKRHLI